MELLTRLFQGFAAKSEDVKMIQAMDAANIGPGCSCLHAQSIQFEHRKFDELQLHREIQDTECEAWKTLEAMIEKAAVDRSREFAPGLGMRPELFAQIVTLPASIGRLKSVKRLYLYGSHLVRIPPEIGQMSNLRELDVYTSYCLHWFPYEITRCSKLRRSRMSTRALYGNYKYRPPFPDLNAPESRDVIPATVNCSVCNRPIPKSGPHRVWISLRLATDVFPLLVSACSPECTQRLPRPPEGYIEGPHTGGLGVKQPPTEAELSLQSFKERFPERFREAEERAKRRAEGQGNSQ